MRIFLSHSHKQSSIAGLLAARLKADGHQVFLDGATLRKGEAFDKRIREEIASCDLFVFVLTSDSIRPDSYARTELGLAQKRWPRPGRHVLPLVLGALPAGDIPPYLAATTLRPYEGDPIAGVVNDVATLASQRRRKRVAVAVTSVGLATGTLVLVALEPGRAQVATVQSDSGASPLVQVTDPAPTDVSVEPPLLQPPVKPVRQRTPRPSPQNDSGCLASVETERGRNWLICRCPDPDRAPPSLPLVKGAAEAEAEARAAGWTCP